jgi:predicted  nucleic acid-binding Zn-ribbon protein
MRTRHRIPSVFNLSMVDVLCCALGCVILLWLLNLREARQKAAQAGQSDEQVVALRRDLDAARTQLADLTGKYAAAQEQVADSERRANAVRAQLEAVQSERDAATTRIGLLEKDLVALRSDKASTEAMLAKRTREVTDLEKKRSAAADRIAALEADLRDRGADAAAAARRADDFAARMKDAEARVRGLEKEVNQRLRGMEDAEKGLAARDRDIDRYKKDLDAARRSIAALEDEKKGLSAAVERERLAADNRFAGIQLTGRRVVFLVDMSGSMEYVDEKTVAPEKWSGVRDTLSKIMRSLPDLEKFQVILFSDTVTFLLGEQSWLDYDSKSAERVTEAIKKIKPKGGTNMYAAFEATFRFRGLGLDTVYFLSDGLPNMGEGLSEEQAKGLKDTEQADILGKYVRRKLREDWNRDIRGQGRVRVNAVGFYYESPDVGAFLWALTRENDGGFVGMSKP